MSKLPLAVLVLIGSALVFSVSHSRASQSDNPTEQLQPLGNAILIAAFAGKTHVGFYRDFLERYGSIQFEETYFANGTLIYKGGGITTTGDWSIENGRICFDYENPDFLPGCFVVTASQGCYYSYEVNSQGDIPVIRPDNWWIFSFVVGTKPDCTEAELIS